MSLLKKQTNHFGLDIGSNGIRAVQLKPSADKPSLVTYGSLPIDPGMSESDSEVDMRKLSEAIKKLVKDSGITTKKVVAGLPSGKIHTAVVSMPEMSHQELAKSVVYQAKEYIPLPLKEVKLDWALLGTDEGRMEVLLVAVNIGAAERYLKILEGAGLEVLALEPDAMALARSLTGQSENAVVVLNLGNRSTDLVTVHRGVTKLIRSISIGTNTIIRAASQNLSLEEDQAKDFVYKFGMAQSKLEGQVRNAIKPTIDSLVSELDKSNKYFLSGHKETSVVEKIVISGQASVLPEIPTYFANSCNLPVEIGNPYQNVAIPSDSRQSLESLASSFAVATGLALRGMN